jgi:hypothetical protein
LLCQKINPPPDTLKITVPAPDAALTTRERFSEHSTNALCAGCHTMMDPIGFGLEGFDAIGAYRETDHQKPVDVSGSLNHTDVDGAFVGPVELGAQLAKSTEARACFARHWLEYSQGVGVGSDARPALDAVVGEFIAGNASVRDLIVALVRSDIFVKRVKPS